MSRHSIRENHPGGCVFTVASREFITRLDIVQMPGLAEFVKRYNNYWTEAELPLEGFVGPMPEERERLYAQPIS